MKILWLTNSSMMLQPTIESLATIPHWDNETKIIFHDKLSKTSPSAYIPDIYSYGPDLVFYIGAGNGPDVMHPAVLNTIKRHVHAFIHICVDAGCPGWWDTLKTYKEGKCFHSTVGIDGSFEWPKGTVDLVTLTPSNPSYYKIKPFRKRTIPLGFFGGLGSPERQHITNALVNEGGLTLGGLRSEQWDSYQPYADFMCDCQAVLNMARTGMNVEYMHVKNRVLETAMAKACLFEQAGSPTSRWFTPGEDYLEWSSPRDVMRLLKDDKSGKEEIASNFHVKVKEFHSAKTWFQKILNLI